MEKIVLKGQPYTNNYVFKRKILYLCTVLLSIICFILIVKNNFYASYAADSSLKRTLCYRPVLVEQGDSLWSIASDNMTEEWGSVDKYVKAIKEFNGMDTYDIFAGTYISIPYYENCGDN